MMNSVSSHSNLLPTRGEIRPNEEAYHPIYPKLDLEKLFNSSIEDNSSEAFPSAPHSFPRITSQTQTKINSPKTKVSIVKQSASEWIPEKLCWNIKKSIVPSVFLFNLTMIMALFSNSIFLASLTGGIAVIGFIAAAVIYFSNKTTAIEIIYSNNNRYIGNVSDGKPHGSGTYYGSVGGYILEGEFKDGKPNGAMSLCLNFGKDKEEWYLGEFKNNEFCPWESKFEHLKGKFSDEGNFILTNRYYFDCNYCFKNSPYYFYEGEYLPICKPHGNGFCVFKNGDKYEGNWVNGKKHGKGIYTAINGEKVECEYVNDKRIF